MLQILQRNDPAPLLYSIQDNLSADLAVSIRCKNSRNGMFGVIEWRVGRLGMSSLWKYAIMPDCTAL